uniref:Sugar phosphate phosphatase n=1 Tax=Aceria tosichella TaxID=561515 RepID=A0A6G1SG50_9ACAR
MSVKIPPPLSAEDRSSFAYATIKDRLPVIIVKTIDFFYRQKKELHKYGGTIERPTDAELAEIEEDAKNIIPKLTKLRKELETNKSVGLLEKRELPPHLAYFNDDVDIWNQTMEAHKFDDGELPRYFESPWLLVESYVYRKIKDICLESKHLKMFDPFAEQKQAACKASLQQMLIVADHLSKVDKAIRAASNHSHSNERTEFGLFLQLALWANRSDLSLSAGSADKVTSHELLDDIKKSLDGLKENILCDNLSEVWNKAQAIKDKIRTATQGIDKPVYIDLVADNSGYEIFVDLCLIHFLTLMICPVSLGSSGVRFRFHLKRMPWYVSDTMRHDITWLLGYMSEHEALKDLAEKWKSFFDSGFWEIHDHKFWTLPHDFAEMPTVSPDLYESLQQSSLIIIKGDLNYRKLTGDRKWHILTPFRAALRAFTPAPLVALRTAKADVVVGIEDINIYAKINNNQLPRNWMISGEYGLIQYYDPS